MMYSYSRNIYSETQPDSTPTIPINTEYVEPTLNLSAGLNDRSGLDSNGFYIKGDRADSQFPFLCAYPLPIYDPLIETKPQDIYFQAPQIDTNPVQPERWITNTELTNLLYNVYTDGTPKYNVGQQTSGSNELESRQKYMIQMQNLNQLLANPDPTIANAIGAKDKLAGILEEIKLRDPQFYMTIQSGNHEARLEGLQKEMIRLNEQMLSTNINTNDVNAFIIDVNSFINKYIDEKDIPEDVLYTYEKLDTQLVNFLARPDISKQQKDRLRALIPKLNELAKSSVMESKMESEADYFAKIKAGREEELETIASMGSVKDMIALQEKLSKMSGSVFTDPKVEELKNKHLDELRELARVVKGSDRKTINDMISELLTKPRVPPTVKTATPESESSVSIPSPEEVSPKELSKPEQMLEEYKNTISKLSDDGKAYLMTKLRGAGLKGNMTSIIKAIVDSGDLDQMNTLDELIAESSRVNPEEKEPAKSKKLKPSETEPPSYEESTGYPSDLPEKDKLRYKEKERDILRLVKTIDTAELNEIDLETELKKSFSYKSFIPHLMRYLKLNNVPADVRNQLGSKLLQQDKLSAKVVKIVITNSITGSKKISKKDQADILEKLEFLYKK